jgi:hypothetical protein
MDIEIIAIHIYNLVKEIARESDTANIWQRILEARLQVLTATGNGS